MFGSVEAWELAEQKKLPNFYGTLMLVIPDGTPMLVILQAVQPCEQNGEHTQRES